MEQLSQVSGIGVDSIDGLSYLRDPRLHPQPPSPVLARAHVRGQVAETVPRLD
jgi:hypothetical protein